MEEVIEEQETAQAQYVNPHDPCVANKMINHGEQMTVTWHVDDLKISHMDSNEVTKCIEHFKKCTVIG